MNEENMSNEMSNAEKSGLQIITELTRDPLPYEAEETNTSLLRVKTADQWLIDAASRPDPVPLYDCLWNEGEVCCLFADSNLGKSIYAVQIAYEVSCRQKVLYFDFELSDKQFQLRYTNSDGYFAEFGSNFIRCEMDPFAQVVGDFEDAVMQSIEQTALKEDARVLIIDNLTWLCNASEKGDAAGILMKNLMLLKARHDWSILVIAHTPKRSLSSPITQNDLAGSKKLFNFFDSVFAIGQSATDSGLRYIKQIKVRSGEFKYDADNVMTAEIVKDGHWLHFNTIGYDTERNHLKDKDEKERDTLIDEVRRMHQEGKLYKEISGELGISISKVCRLLKSAS